MKMNTTDSNFSAAESMDDENYKNFLLYSRFWVQRILVPCLMTIGIVGNMITIVIMTRRRMRSSTNNYLAALAIFDMMYLIFTFILSLSHYPGIPDSENYAYWAMKPFILMLTDTCSNTSVWLTVTFTVERYIAVCHPMKGKVFCTESRAKKAIVVVFLFCFAFTFPTPFEWVVDEKLNESTNRTTLFLNHSDMGKNSMYQTIYYWLTVVFFIFIPFILLAIFNSFLIRSVHMSKAQRSSMTRGENDNSQENKITIMLIAVVILFFFCQLPTACHLLYSTLRENFTTNELYLLRGLGNIFNFLMSLNSAGNFVLYCLLSQKYRRTFVQIFCPCLREKRSNMNSVYYQSTTVVSNVDTDSPGSSASRRMSGSRVSRHNSPKGSSFDVSRTSENRGSPAGSARAVLLQVPQKTASTKVVYDDDDLDSLHNDARHGSGGTCGPCRKVIRSPLRRLRRTMGVGKKETREQVIPLKGGGNKCIVITAPESMPAETQWNSNSAV